MKKIPFHKVHTGKKEFKNLKKVLKNGWLTMGPLTLEFEKNLLNFLKSKAHEPQNITGTLTASSCTACLHLALILAGVKEGDEVIVPTNTFVATAEVAVYLKAIPVLADIDYSTGNISIEDLERKITPKTKAVMVVHFSGHPADLDSVKELVEHYSTKFHGDKNYITIVEDAAHALPAFYKGKIVGEISPYTCYSFYATKTLAAGEGGAISFGPGSRKEDIERFAVLRLHGMSKHAWKRYSDLGSWYYEVIETGYKYNFTDLGAALALAQLENLIEMWEKRKKIAQKYREYLKELEDAGYLKLPQEMPYAVSSWHLFVIKVSQEAQKAGYGRNDLINFLRENGVGTSVHFIPLHRHPAYRKFVPPSQPIEKIFPNAEKFFSGNISLPIFPDLPLKDVEYISEKIKEFFLKKSA